MIILSLQLGHNATALLMRDGVVLASISQERFDNIKNSDAFPVEAIHWLVNQAAISLQQVDRLVISGVTLYPQQAGLTSKAISSPSLFARFSRWAVDHFCYYAYGTILFDVYAKLNDKRVKKLQEVGRQDLLKRLQALGFQADKIDYVEHHTCHAYSPLYFYGHDNKDWLILTLDGAGDFSSGSVNVWRNGKFETLASIPILQSLGYVYSRTTQFMGMKALEHEYKVMGLAAYAKPDYFMATYNKIFAHIVWPDPKQPLSFQSRFPLNRFDTHLRKHAVGERFDNLAGALQYFLEQQVLAWVQAAIAQTGIQNIMTSGGVFMNVKLNKLIRELPQVDTVRFMPSCGDESNCFGAAYYAAAQAGTPPVPTGHLYLGAEYSNDAIRDYLDQHGLHDKYIISFHDDIEKKIAGLLADRHVVARFAGRAEFGARSLGNRAILAYPADMRSFFMVNDQVKMRDFWMPFAPSILESDADLYLRDRHGAHAPFMIDAFDTTPTGQDHLRAAMHQGDKSVRPQIVTPGANARYHALIAEFKNLTGIGAVMNTSFNLHGFPLVTHPWQAFFTFERCDLEFLALESWLIQKKK